MDENLSQLVTDLWKNPRTMTENHSITLTPSSVAQEAGHSVAAIKLSNDHCSKVTEPVSDPDLDRLRYSL
jgi:hypothetical protein